MLQNNASSQSHTDDVCIQGNFHVPFWTEQITVLTWTYCQSKLPHEKNDNLPWKANLSCIRQPAIRNGKLTGHTREASGPLPSDSFVMFISTTIFTFPKKKKLFYARLLGLRTYLRTSTDL